MVGLEGFGRRRSDRAGIDLLDRIRELNRFTPPPTTTSLLGIPRKPRRSDREVALCMTAGAVLMAVCATGLMGASGTMVALAATGFAIGVGGPSRDMMIKRATPKGATGRVYGIVYSGLDTGFAVAPLVFGVMMDNGWYRAVLLGGAFTLLLAVGAALGVGLRTRAAEGAAGAAAA